jgi:glucosylglycerate synthase
MAAISSEVNTSSTASATATSKLLVVLTPLPPEALEATLGRLSLAFIGNNITVSTPDLGAEAAKNLGQDFANLEIVSDAVAAPSSGSWVLTAADFLNLHKTSQEHGACLLLGPEAQTLRVEAMRALASAISNGGDLAVPRYATGPREGLVNSALLYPVSRAIFGGQPRFPLALDLGLSRRMVDKLATVAQRFTAANQNDALIWPVAEACASGYSVVEVEAGARSLPQPAGGDLNAVLAQVGASLFAMIETNAAFWQRSRVGGGRQVAKSPVGPDDMPEVEPMIDAFRVAYRNLQEIWSLVLPPNSLLALKRLSQAPADAFRMGDSLWARIVYDFILAYRLRTINRGHLLGALTPLYLAWVASHFLLARTGVDPEVHIEEMARIFESDKAYLVSRWRWPDRFNP